MKEAGLHKICPYLINENGTLRQPLYHGTTAFFLPDIMSNGLGGDKKISNNKYLELAKVVYHYAVELLSENEFIKEQKNTFLGFIDKLSGDFKSDHGVIYLGTNFDKALSYSRSGINHQFLAYLKRFLILLSDLKLSKINKDLYNEYPDIIQLVAAEHSPIIIKINKVNIDYLKTESNITPMHEYLQRLETLRRLDKLEGRQHTFDGCSFRLIKAIPSKHLSFKLVVPYRRHNLKLGYSSFKIEM